MYKIADDKICDDVETLRTFFTIYGSRSKHRLENAKKEKKTKSISLKNNCETKHRVRVN